MVLRINNLRGDTNINIHKDLQYIDKNQYVIVLLSILLSKSLYYESYGNNILLVFLSIIMIVYFLFIQSKSKVLFPKTYIFIVLVLFCMILINPNTSLKTMGVFFAMSFIALLISSTIQFENYAILFFRIMMFLMAVSFLRYFFIFLDIPPFLPPFHSIINDKYQNFIFFGTLSGGVFFNTLRNNGLWWEPGALQTFINIAFIFGLILKKINFKNYLFFAISIITTFSTTGVIVFVLLSIIYFRNFQFKKKTIFIIAFFLVAITTIISANVFEVILSKFNPTSANYASLSSRVSDLLIDFNIYKDYPIIGSGLGNLKLRNKYTEEFARHAMGATGTDSNGLSTLIEMLGIFSFLIIIPFLFPKYTKNYRKVDRFLISSTLLIMFSAENFSFTLIFMILFAYSFSNCSNRIHIIEYNKN